MKKKLLLFSFLIISMIFFFILFRPDEQLKINIHSKILKSRNFKQLTIIDSITFPIKTSLIYHLESSENLLLVPFEIVDKFYKMENKILKDTIYFNPNYIFNDILVSTNGNTYATFWKKDTAIIVHLNSKRNTEFRLKLQERIVGFFNDEAVYLQTLSDSVFLKSVNIYTAKHRTIINLTKYWKKLAPIDNLNYTCQLTSTNNRLLIKSIYSSFGLLLDSLNNICVQSIDSLELPEIKIDTLDKGIFQMNVNPSLYSSSQIFAHSNYFYNFSEIGIDNNSYYLDVYNFDYKYLFSYRIPFANKIKPYSIAINFDKNEISVLYNDYFTLKKFSY